MADVPNSFDEYVLAKQALWAGDMQFALDRLELINGHGRPVNRTDPESVVRWRAQKLWDFLREREFDVPSAELIVQTEHLRGLFSRTSERGFEMRAFLLDLNWDEELLLRSRSVAVARQREEGSSDERRDFLQEVAADTGQEVNEDGTASWTEVRENTLVEVAVSEFALLRVRLTWFLRTPPESLEPIRATFQAVLNELEAGQL